MPGGGQRTGSCTAACQLVMLVLTVLTTAKLTVSLVSQVQAESSRTIDATVQVSVCGNNVVEGGEQCDNADLAGKTCISLQYESGTLACTKSCDYDLSRCVPFVNFAGEVLIPAIARQPTPSPQPTLFALPLTTTKSAELAQQNVVATEQLPEVSLQPQPPTNESQVSDDQTAQLPQSLEAVEFRLRSIYELLEVEAVTETNQISQAYLPMLIRNWSQSWRKTTTLARFTTPIEVEQHINKCDVNGDGVCTVEDLSILLYYVSPDSMEQLQ